jgi:hypothetical protein
MGWSGRGCGRGRGRGRRSVFCFISGCFSFPLIWPGTDREGTYIAPKARRRRDFIAAIEERVKYIRRVIYLLDVGNRLYRRPEDQCWEEDGDGEVWLVFFHEFPDSFVGFFLADAVGDVGVLGFLSVFYCELGEFVSLGMCVSWIGKGRGTNW